MSLQTAPDTITIATGSGNTIASLFNVSDTGLEYRVTTLDGVAIADVTKRPTLLIVRKAPTSGATSTKYHIKLEQWSYDALGVKTGKFQVYDTVTIPNRFYSDAGGQADALVKFKAGLMATSFIGDMVHDGSFAR